MHNDYDQPPQIIIIWLLILLWLFRWWELRSETLQIPNGIAIKLISFYSGGNGILIENAIFTILNILRLWWVFGEQMQSNVGFRRAYREQNALSINFNMSFEYLAQRTMKLGS